MRHETFTTYPSPQARSIHPDFDPAAPHARAVEMAEKIAELAGSAGNVTERDLAQAGFSVAEIVEHSPAALKLASGNLVKQVAPSGDRVPEIIEKALIAAAHAMPVCAGIEATDEMTVRWKRYCAASAAYRLDPWVSQGERCIALLSKFLALQPMLPREVDRVIYAIAAAQLAERRRRG